MSTEPGGDPHPGLAPILNGVLFHIPWSTRAGYAMDRALAQFLAIGRRLTGCDTKVHFGFSGATDEVPRPLEGTDCPIHRLTLRFTDEDNDRSLTRVVGDHGIDLVVGYDLPVKSPCYPVLRRAGARTLVSYLGAPMSSDMGRLRLAVRRARVRLTRGRPDHFIFQSEAMRRTAVEGRGIPRAETSVVYTGVSLDDQVATPEPGYAHRALGIPEDRRIVVYAGHIRRRKGIHVLLDAAADLALARARGDVHFVLLGSPDHGGEEFVRRCRDRGLDAHVSFAGYRTDVHAIFQGAYLGVLPTTGWDSFPRSGLEMQGCGIPLLVSDLHGLPELIQEGRTGHTFPAGDDQALADLIETLLDSPDRASEMGDRAREWVREEYSPAKFIDRFANVLVPLVNAGAERVRGVSPDDRAASGAVSGSHWRDRTAAVR